MKRIPVHLLLADMEEPASLQALRDSLGETVYQRVCGEATGRYLGVWLGDRGDARVPLKDETDLAMLTRLAIDLGDNLGAIRLVPLALAPEATEAMRRELDRFCQPARRPRKPSLRLVVDNTIRRRPRT